MFAMGCNVKHALWLWVLIFCPFACAAPCPAGQAKDEGALIHIERSWARNPAALDCILAEEFQDADPQGNIRDRPATLAKAADHGLSTMNCTS
jgi:hypothetical protein